MDEQLEQKRKREREYYHKNKARILENRKKPERLLVKRAIDKRYCDKNREKRKENCRKWYHNNKDKPGYREASSARSKKHYRENLEHAKILRRKRYEKNKPAILEQTKAYAKKHRAHLYQKGKEWRARNRDSILKKEAAYREKHRQQFLEWKRKWRERNPRASAEYYRKNKAILAEKERIWRQNNRARCCEKGARRRAKLRNQTPKNANKKLIMAFYYAAQRISACTKIPFHVDHHIPIDKGGLHHQGNLRILTASANCRKRNKVPA
jgi:hypothetical protein